MGLLPIVLVPGDPPLLQVPDQRRMEVSFLTAKQLLPKSQWGLSSRTGLVVEKQLKS